MTKYKWSMLGVIVSAILFLIFLINPLISFKNSTRFVPTVEIPETIREEIKAAGLWIDKGKVTGLYQFVNPDLNIERKPLSKLEEIAIKDYEEWYRYVSKKFVWSSLNVIWKSFYHWNLFWIPIIVFSFMAYNYKKLKK